MSLNRVLILGRLGKDPGLKMTPSGQAVCNFLVVTSEKYKDKSGQYQEKTEWHNIVAWGKLAELCYQYLSKGRQAFIEGKLQTSSWDDKDGNKRYKTEILASTVQFLGGQGDNQHSNSRNNQEPTIAPDSTFASDDIPF